MSDGMGRESAYLSSHATNRYFIPNWGIEMIITTDPHSPSSARVNAALPHIDAWYKAFNVKKGQKLFIPANKRARIW